MTEQAAEHTPVQRRERGRHWDRWLEELRALPAEAPEWDGVAAFVAALQQLTEIKRQDRDSRSRLQQTLARLVTKCSDELTFFDLIDVTSWTAKTCPLAEVLTLAAQVEQFQAGLLRYRDLRQQPTASAAADSQRRRALDELDEQITQQHSRLAAVLSPSTLALSPQQEQSPAPRKELSLSEEGVPVDLSFPPQPLDTAPASLESGVLLTPTESTKPAVEVALLESTQPIADQESALTVTNGAGPATATEEPATAAALPLEFRSPQETAVLLQHDDRDENWHTLLWACIAADDLPMAYWLARSLQASGRPGPAPDWLLAAGQGARWLSPHSEDFVGELLEIAGAHQPDTDEAKLLGLAAMLRPALLAPHSEFVSWLVVPDFCPVLRNLVSPVTALAHLGRALRSEDPENMVELRGSISKALPEVEPALVALSSPTQPLSLAAAARCLRRTIGQIRETLLLPSASSGVESSTPSDWEWLPFGTRSLFVALSRRLLWLPEIPLSDDGQPTSEALPQIAPRFRDTCAAGRTLRAALEQWIEQQDYRFVDILLHVLHRSESDFPLLSRRYQDALANSRAVLHDQTAQTQTAIEQAVMDGLISDERTDYNVMTESVHPDETLQFPPQYAALQQVQAELAAARQKRLETLRTDWQNLQTRLTESIAPATCEQISAFVQSAADRGDTQLVREAVARLTTVLEANSPLEEEWFTSRPPARTPLAEFLEATPQIETWMEKEVGLLQPIATDIRQGRARAGIAFGELPTARLKEASAAIETWRQLKQRKAQGDGSVQSITLLLRYLGFTFEPRTAAPVQVEQRSGDWVQGRAHMSAGDLAIPIPQLGSQAQGRYDVACIWQRPGVDTLSAWLRDLRSEIRHVLVFYLGRLTPRQRHDLMLRARNQDLALLVLDETLLVFLARERDARLPVFFACALPFAAFNPYASTPVGEVPAEMFFGREALTRELQRPEGSCLLYGGRHVGKSALLQHAQREFHHPEHEHYAWVENLTQVGTSPDGQSTQTVWQKLHDACKTAGLIAQRVTADRPEEIARYVAEALRAVPERRLLMLYDNADHFLDADAKDRFGTLEALRKLMVDTQRRFKVVFAGEHQVQRFHCLPYQPLAPFGDPLVVGSLEPAAARRLVTEPFATLGYRFVDEAAVLRILACTNYHPGLIQLFCHELLTRLQGRPDGDAPPYSIAQSDVEDVYRNRKVREGIREQFESTLALDPHYQTLIWTMVLEQRRTGDGFSHAYPPDALWQMARPSWPRGENLLDETQLRGLLDEMCGLGVLGRNGGGHYRLRNPNLLRLLGADIEDRLLKLAQL